MSEDHFLDTNIIIGSRVNWDIQHNPAAKYFARYNVRRHTSNKVREEVERYFNRTRAAMLAFMHELGKNVPMSGRVVTDRDIDRFASDFKIKRNYSNEDRVWSSLRRFIDDKRSDIKYAISGGKVQVRIYSNEIVYEFDGVFASIDEDCRPEAGARIMVHAGCPDDYGETDEYKALSSLISNPDDVKILLDSYHVGMEVIKDSVDFVTLDVKDIVSKKSVIETILKGIFILYPVI